MIVSDLGIFILTWLEVTMRETNVFIGVFAVRIHWWWSHHPQLHISHHQTNPCCWAENHIQKIYQVSHVTQTELHLSNVRCNVKNRHWCSHLNFLVFCFAVIRLNHQVDLQKQYVEMLLHCSLWLILCPFGFFFTFARFPFWCILLSVTNCDWLLQFMRSMFTMFYNVTLFLIKLSGKAFCLLWDEGNWTVLNNISFYFHALLYCTILNDIFCMNKPHLLYNFCHVMR